MPLTAGILLGGETAKLRDMGRADLVGDVAKLMAHVLDVTPSRLNDASDRILTGEQVQQFTSDAQALVQGAPLSKFIGRRAFWNDEFFINRDVLDPRPDTETLVEAALEVPFERVLDLGTGSGCILLSLLGEHRAATGVGTDISEAAVEVARRNLLDGGYGAVAKILRSDWYDRVRGRFDLIVSNPPYIDVATYETLDRNVRDYDPKLALTPGTTGLEAYRVIIAQAPQFLTPGGHLMVEIGFDQANAVSDLFHSAGFEDIRVIADINGKDRVIAAILR